MQGYHLTPVLFTIFFCMILKPATKDVDEEDGVYIYDRLDGNLFNNRRLQTLMNTIVELIGKLRFSDDVGPFDPTERAFLHNTAATQLFRQEISLNKT